MCVCVCVCVCVYIYIYIYIYMRQHTCRLGSNCGDRILVPKSEGKSNLGDEGMDTTIILTLSLNKYGASTLSGLT